jgi:alkylation response protein AidB-like acyl-CoA dehydrogenase
MALAMYQELTRGVISVLVAHGTEVQKKKYIPNMIAGKWSGTMDLTEPHAGTDLGMMRTRASLQADGSYKISGAKIFISGGDQDMTENIIHLVLAKIDGGPPGIKGVSLFVVPKTLVNDDGSLGGPNHVHCGSIEHKMGIRGSATCVLNYSDATGWLVGEEHKGMQAMFVMMNEARLAVGTLGLAQSEIAYQNAAAYAKERLQGRALSGAIAPDRPADPIIVHPDVRRTLLSIRAFNEAARAFTIWAALKGDMAECADTIGERTRADDYLSLLTPVIKGFLSDRGFANTVAAQQIFGGHGYIVETGVEQFVRDSRIAMLYEGANGIQALDLVSRKLPKDGGHVVAQFIREIGEFLEAGSAAEYLAPILTSLRESLNHLDLATTWLLTGTRSQPERTAAASTDYLHLFGLVALGYMWAQMTSAAYGKLVNGAETEYFRNKLVVGTFFAQNSLPETAILLKRVREGSKVSLELPMEAF